eukprot:Hpha_TRINITY_DN5342_c0_g1::TRINITY_DN5342_c0_g1_i1::g.32857::m.32857
MSGRAEAILTAAAAGPRRVESLVRKIKDENGGLDLSVIANVLFLVGRPTPGTLSLLSEELRSSHLTPSPLWVSRAAQGLRSHRVDTYGIVKGLEALTRRCPPSAFGAKAVADTLQGVAGLPTRDVEGI